MRPKFRARHVKATPIQAPIDKEKLNNIWILSNSVSKEENTCNVARDNVIQPRYFWLCRLWAQDRARLAKLNNKVHRNVRAKGPAMAHGSLKGP